MVYLEISAAEGVRRTSGPAVRPLLAGGDRAEKFRALMADRVPLYRQVATLRVNTNRRNPGAVVRHIMSRLEREGTAPPPGGRGRRRRPGWRRDESPPREGARPTPAALAARRPEGTQ